MAHAAVKSSHSVHRTSFSTFGQQQQSSECHAQKFCPRIQHTTPAGHHNVSNTNRTESKILRKTYGVWRTRKHGRSRVSRNSASGSFSAGAIPPEGSSAEVPAAQVPGSDFEEQLSARKEGGLKGWFKNLQMDAGAARAKVAKLGLAAVLAYGLLDGVTYTIAFTLAFLGYEKSTGLNPARNLKSLLGIVVLMWTSNNVTRPLRVTAAAAAAPLVDRFLKRLQKALNLPNQVFAFAITVAVVAGTCLSIAGLLILSRLGS